MSKSPSRSRSHSLSAEADMDETASISSVSTINTSSNISGLPTTIEIHPLNAAVTATTNTNQQFIKRPLNAYMIWTREQRQKIHHEPGKKQNEISRAMGEVWKKMSDAEKAPYFELAKKHSAEHKRTLKDNPNLAYIPSRKKARQAIKEAEKEAKSHPPSPGLSEPGPSPAVFSHPTTFAPMSPAYNGMVHHPQSHGIMHPSQGQQHMAPRVVYYQSAPGQEGSYENPQHVRVIPSARVQQPTLVYDSNTYMVMAPPPAGRVVDGHQASHQQVIRQPQPHQSSSQQQPVGDQYLTSTQIRDRYYASLCQPQFPNAFQSPSDLRDPNYYYDLHLQLFKTPL